jgi:hypothetical protein
MNNASFDIELHVPKPDINWKNHFRGYQWTLFSFRRRFNGLDEITPYHDYPNIFCGIYHEWLCGGISFYGFHIKIPPY